MNVYYESTKLQRLCDSAKNAQRVLGGQSARKFHLRLQELVNAPALSDISSRPPQRLHQMKSAGTQEFAVLLHGGDRLVFRIGHDSVPVRPDGGVDLDQVRTVIITFVGDYHG